MTFLLCHSGGLIVNGTEPWKGLWFGSQALGVPLVIILVILETQKSYLKCRKHLACAIKG